MAKLEVFEANLVCDCGAYWVVHFYELDNDHVCPQCKKKLRVHIVIEVTEAKGV